MKREQPLRKSPSHSLKKSSGLKAFGGLSRPSKPLKKSKGLRKQSEAFKAGKEDRIAHGAAMMLLFTKHWDEHINKRCESCQKQLYGENNTMYHEHLLWKSKYPEFALEIDNLYLICPECHSLSTAGIYLPNHLEAIEKAKRQFL